jgi:hypothetical protein
VKEKWIPGVAGVADPGYSCNRKSTMNIEITLSVLVIFTLSPMAQAVSPSPDGGYPGGNTAEGHNALFSLTGGAYNTAVGFLSLKSDTKGQFNTAIGAGALLANVGDQSTGAGVENTATGAGALLNNTTGCCNTANGVFALFSNTNAAENAAFGTNALFSNIEANDNSAFGYEALKSDTGGGNTAVGAYSLRANTNGVLNTAVGESALVANTTGSSNIALGYLAGGNVTTADNVISIGSFGQNLSDSCFIGTPGVHTNTYIAGINGATVVSGTPVLIDNSSKLGTTTSSKRFKQDIKPMGKTSEALLSLKPVTFRYKKEIDPAGTPQFGLVAEEVEKVNPALVVRDKEGRPFSVRYDQVNAMLLNEFLKEHRKVEEQQATIEKLESTVVQQQKGMEALTSRLDQQAAQIQKVSTQIELNGPAPQMVLSNR